MLHTMLHTYLVKPHTVDITVWTSPYRNHRQDKFTILTVNSPRPTHKYYCLGFAGVQKNAPTITLLMKPNQIPALGDSDCRPAN